MDGSSSSPSHSDLSLSNRLLALDDAGYGGPSSYLGNDATRDDELNPHVRDLLWRCSRRSGMLLSAPEIACLWHPPAPGLQHVRLLRFDPHRRELPDYLRDVEGVALGLLREDSSSLPGHEEPTLVPWPDAYRNRHAYFLGATRMGKSTLLGNLIAQDLMSGRGLCLIDPHGDLALDVLRAIPPHREQDVLFLDLSDTAFPVSLGLLQARDEWEKRLLVSDLLSILHRLFASSWGDRLEHILRHALLTLLADEEEVHTLRDIRPLLSEAAYREHLLPHISDPDLRSFWTSEFPGYSATAFAPVYNKLGLLLSSPLVRNIVAGGDEVTGGAEGGKGDKGEGGLDPTAIIRGKRVLIVNLAQSLIGEDNAHFLGALLVSKIQLAAMHGLRQGRSERVPFTLYVDEFQNFVVSSFAKILSEAGKAGLSLVMANQFLEQLNEGLQTAILSNVGALISFRVSAASGRRLEGEFGGLYSARELTDLERGQAIARLGKAGDSFAIRTFGPVEAQDVDADPEAPARITERTHWEICRPRAQVEAGLRESEARLNAIRAAWQTEQGRKKQEEKSSKKAELSQKTELGQKPESKKPNAKEVDDSLPKAQTSANIRAASESKASQQTSLQEESEPKRQTRSGGAAPIAVREGQEKSRDIRPKGGETKESETKNVKLPGSNQIEDFGNDGLAQTEPLQVKASSPSGVQLGSSASLPPVELKTAPSAPITVLASQDSRTGSKKSDDEGEKALVAEVEPGRAEGTRAPEGQEASPPAAGDTEAASPMFFGWLETIPEPELLEPELPGPELPRPKPPES